MLKLPESYVDCVITHVNGNKRIGRVSHDRKYWQLSSYEARNVEVVWKVKDVVKFKVIEY